MVTPHEWRPAAITVLKLSPPATATGIVLQAREPPFWHCSGPFDEPIPSSPIVFMPQQYATPVVVTPQVWFPPALTAAKVSRPATGTGVALPFVAPSPSSP